MKTDDIITPILLATSFLVTSGCSYDDDETADFDASHIHKTWYVAQKAFNGSIAIYEPDNECGRPYLTLEDNYTFEKMVTDNCGQHTTTGTWQLDEHNKKLTLTYNDSVRHCEIHVLNEGTLALQSTFDIDGNGTVESVRETYLAD